MLNKKFQNHKQNCETVCVSINKTQDTSKTLSFCNIVCLIIVPDLSQNNSCNVRIIILIRIIHNKKQRIYNSKESVCYPFLWNSTIASKNKEYRKKNSMIFMIWVYEFEMKMFLIAHKNYYSFHLSLDDDNQKVHFY